jgi:hypothetical protein
MSGAIPLLPITLSWCEQGQIYINPFFNKIRAPQELVVAHRSVREEKEQQINKEMNKFYI